ncbi:hypothetical protein U1Q18_020663 [Sarracenia purpurea var. burkii]
MDDIARWILEFFLRQSVDDRVLNAVLRVLPISNDDSSLKKTMLLRIIESETAKGTVSEKILGLLERIEELDCQEGASSSEAMKKAYCSVAVNCTVRFLDGSVEIGSKYFDAVKRIWRGKVCRMERLEVGLISDELRDWKDDIEAAVWDPSACENVRMKNRGIDALEAVRAYVAEAWERMGPSFLELMSEAYDTISEVLGLGCRRKCEQMVGERAASLPGSPHGLIARNENKETQRGGVLPRRKHVAIKRSRGLTTATSRGVKIADTEELDLRKSSNNYDCLPTPEINKVQAALRDSSLELQAVVKDPLPDAFRLAEKVISSMARENNNQAPSVERQNGVDVDAPDPYRGVKIADTEELDLRKSSNNYDCLPTPEINKVQAALRASSLELQAVVKDPLPDAFRLAEKVISSMARENNNQAPSVERQNGVDVDAPDPSVGMNAEHSPVNEANLNNQSCRHQNNVPKPSLMARNSTAHIYEWDDSIEASSEGSPGHGSRLHLPTPKRRVVSPLKKYEITKLARRMVKKWSTLEEDTLRIGVQKYGKGNWKLILNSYRDIFEERTQVDLKDKWRNMTRY